MCSGFVSANRLYDVGVGRSSLIRPIKRLTMTFGGRSRTEGSRRRRTSSSRTDRPPFVGATAEYAVCHFCGQTWGPPSLAASTCRERTSTTGRWSRLPGARRRLPMSRTGLRAVRRHAADGRPRTPRVTADIHICPGAAIPSSSRKVPTNRETGPRTRRSRCRIRRARYVRVAV